MDVEEYENFVLDIKRTIVSSLTTIIGFPTFVYYIFIFNSIMESFTQPEMVVLGLFVFAWSCIKIMLFLVNSFTLEYKPREMEK